MEKQLHIISFNVPFPANYGGVVDVFYKIRALSQMGVAIHLHCFQYGRSQAAELEQYCHSVHYYPRETGHKAISSKLPYIVASRRNEALLNRLLEDDYPILMEGVHCSYPVQDPRFQGRKLYVRLHNVEYQYYHDLFKSSNSVLRKLFYWNESRLLRRYESELAKKAQFWGVTEKDNEVYRQEFGCQNIEVLPLYTPEWELSCLEGMGSYCLYHGDLSVDANDKAAKWLLNEVFLPLQLPLVISGQNPSKELVDLCHAQNFTCMVENPSEKEMQDMIAKAHINVLPSFTHTGMKVKLLNALSNGKHCLANAATLAGTDLQEICQQANSPKEFQQLIQELYVKPFTAKEREKREAFLGNRFNNQQNAQKQIQWIWG